MPFCTFCGQENADASVACSNCGHPPASQPVAVAYRRTDSYAVWSLILGIAGVVASFPIVFGATAVFLGHRARRRLREDPGLEGAGLAKAGIILGWIGIALGLFFIVTIVTAFVHHAPTTGVDIDALGRFS